MLKVLGLIVVVYAVVRLMQVPVELTAARESWLGVSLPFRVFLVALASAVGIFVLAILAITLLSYGSSPGY